MNRSVSNLRIDVIERHIFLRCDQTKPKFTCKQKSLESWDFLKRRLVEPKLVGQGGVFRTKVNCLQVCMHGPIAVVYLERIWYHFHTPEVLIQEHPISGVPVDEFRFVEDRETPAPIAAE